MKSSKLKLKLSKSEVMLVGRGQYFEELAAVVQSLLVENTNPQLVIVCSLGVL